MKSEFFRGAKANIPVAASAMVNALFGAKIFTWLRDRALSHIQYKVTAVILLLAGGMLACSKK